MSPIDQRILFENSTYSYNGNDSIIRQIVSTNNGLMYSDRYEGTRKEDKTGEIIGSIFGVIGGVIILLILYRFRKKLREFFKSFGETSPSKATSVPPAPVVPTPAPLAPVAPTPAPLAPVVPRRAALAPVVPRRAALAPVVPRRARSEPVVALLAKPKWKPNPNLRDDRFVKKSLPNKVDDPCYKKLAHQYLTKLNLSPTYFDSRFDLCSCIRCGKKIDSHREGWARFGLQVSERDKVSFQILKLWDTSYYGTTGNRVKHILENRFIPLEGHKLANGQSFSSGHRYTSHCITSPSLDAASRAKYGKRYRMILRDGHEYNIYVVLQCKQRPATYECRKDSENPNYTEWLTTTVASVVPYGIMIRVENI